MLKYFDVLLVNEFLDGSLNTPAIGPAFLRQRFLRWEAFPSFLVRIIRQGQKNQQGCSAVATAFPDAIYDCDSHKTKQPSAVEWRVKESCSWLAVTPQERAVGFGIVAFLSISGRVFHLPFIPIWQGWVHVASFIVHQYSLTPFPDNFHHIGSDVENLHAVECCCLGF